MEKRVLFFDGECNLCNGFVDFMIRRSQIGTIYFSSLQSEYAKKTLPLELTRDLKTFVYLRSDKIYLRSEAVLRAVSELGGMWRSLLLFLIIPSTLRDIVYNLVAKNRFHWFGKRDTCRIPSKEERELFLE
jgi:predicted DCC family thiol-disulfide oxidoreductase YuxK